MKPIDIHSGQGVYLVVVLSTFLAVAAYAADSGKKEIGRTTERELNVVLTSSFGNVYVSKGEREKILLGEMSAAGGVDQALGVEYSVRNRIGYLELTVGGGEGQEGEPRKHNIRIGDFRGGKSSLRFSDAIPISFDIKLGVGKGQFDLSGLQVKDFNLETGASDVYLSFDEPNKTAIQNLNIESGLSKFTGQNLCNANFRQFRFQGGVGTYTLDFSGKLKSEVDVDIVVGLGVMTIYIPSDVGAKIHHEKSWISTLSCDQTFSESSETEFTSDNYDNVAARMNIRIESGLGSVKVKRR